MRKISNWIWFFVFIGIFFTIPIYGTLLHEVGHYLMAVIYNQPAGIAYAYTYTIDPYILTNDQYFWFIVGGPVSTWVTAGLGLTVILGKYRSMHSESDKTVGYGQILATIAAAFSLRFVFNAGGYLFSTLWTSPWDSNMDEVKIATSLGIHPYIIVYGSAIIAVSIVLITLYYIPRHQRYIVLLAGIIGGAIGYIFWYYLAGPLLLPLPP